MFEISYRVPGTVFLVSGFCLAQFTTKKILSSYYVIVVLRILRGMPGWRIAPV